MNMEREQIIKALECCSRYSCNEDCEECPLNNNGCEQNKLEGLALALIKELTEENEFLLNIKNLNIDKVKADTVWKMQERLCEGRVSNDPVVIAANVVAKEMLEE